MPVLMPVFPPPKLEDCCCLSEPAQIVWRAMVEKQRREKLIQQERKRQFLSFSKDYYQSLYETKFKSSLPSVSTQKSSGDRDRGSQAATTDFINQTHFTQTINVQPCESTHRIVIKTERSTSPDVTCALQGPTSGNSSAVNNLLEIPLAFSPTFPDSSSLLFENNIYPSRDISKDEDAKQSENKEVSHLVPSQDLFSTCPELSPPLDLSPTYPVGTNNNDEKPLFTINADFLSQNITVSGVGISEDNSTVCVPLYQELHTKNENCDITMEKDGYLPASDCGSSAEIPALLQSGSNGTELEQVEPEHNQMNSKEHLPNTEGCNSIIADDNTKTTSFTKNCSPVKICHDEDQLICNQAAGMLPVNKDSRANCSINARLKEHQKIRKRIEDKEETAIEKRTESKKNVAAQARPIAKFFAPFKKLKLSDQNVESSKIQKFEYSNTAGEETVEDKVKRINKMDKSSDILLITVMFSDGSTQLSTHPSSMVKSKCVKNAAKPHINGFIISAGQINEQEDIVRIKLDELRKEEKESVRKVISEMMSSDTEKICFGAKEYFKILIDHFDMRVFRDCKILDPEIAAWLSNPDKPVASFSNLIESLKISRKVLHGELDFQQMKEDFYVLKLSMDILKEKLQQQDLLDLFYGVEMNLVPILAKMELRDICIETKTLLGFSDILKKKLTKLEKQAHDSVGHSFQINSHVQLRQVIFEELKLDQKLTKKTRIAKTNSGHLKSTSEAVLAQFTDIHPLPALVLDYRQLQKLKSTYIDGILSCVTDGRLRTKWDQASAATGRLASSQPNIQAIPKTAMTVTNYKDNYIAGKEIDDCVEIYAREPFVSQHGWTLLAADFQQIELRLLAHLTNDEVLLKLFSNSDSNDIFMQLTSEWLGKSVDDISSFEREQTKRIVYSVMYGADFVITSVMIQYTQGDLVLCHRVGGHLLHAYSSNQVDTRRLCGKLEGHGPPGKEKLSEYLKISVDEAKAIMTSFLIKFPAVNRFTKKCTEYCQMHGYTTTIFNRRRLFPNINHHSPVVRAHAERQAVNFCVQGSAADICKTALIELEKALQDVKPPLNARLLVQIHDELLLEVPDDEVDVVKGIIRMVMESSDILCGNFTTLKVPLKVSLSVGKSWGHMSHCLLEE